MWNIEDTTYTLDEMLQIMQTSLKKYDLPVYSDSISLYINESPGVITLSYLCNNLGEHNTPSLYMEFCVNFGTRESYDANFYVKPEIRRKGYGRKLVNAREDFCSDVGIDVIILTAVLPEAKGFWQKMGYQNNQKSL